MKELDDFYNALDVAVSRAGNPNKFARYTGIPVQTLNRWCRRESQPNLEGVISLLPFIDWPKRSVQNPLIKRIDGNSKPEEVTGDNLVRIPVILDAGAGNPVDVWNSDPGRWIEVLPEYAHADTRAVRVCGDSMEPTIKDRSIVGVEPFSGEFQEGKIYLCRIPYFGTVVKRVHMDGMKGIVLISDNKRHDEMHIPFEDCDNLIIGRVLWYWQEA